MKSMPSESMTDSKVTMPAEMMMDSEMAMPNMQRRRILIVAAVVVTAVLWYLFRPELLFISSTVNEAFPVAGDMPAGMPRAAGRFHSVAHDTVGQAMVFELDHGKRLLRLTGFETSNGPDVHVLLSKASDASDNDTVKNAGYLDLGSLKGNIGDQNYEIPADANLADYNSVTIWCKRFSVNFGTAPLKMN